MSLISITIYNVQRDFSSFILKHCEPFFTLPSKELASGLMVNVSPDFRMGPFTEKNFLGIQDFFLFQFILDLETKVATFPRSKEIVEGAFKNVLQHTCCIKTKGRLLRP